MSVLSSGSKPEVRSPKGRQVLIGASGTTASDGTLTLAYTYGGQLTVTGGPTSYVFKLGRFKRLLSFVQNNSQGTNGSRTQKPVQSVTAAPTTGTVTVVFDTTIASSVIQMLFIVER